MQYDDLFEDMRRIEIDPPQQVDGSFDADARVTIEDPETIRAIAESLVLEESSRDRIAECKVPPGFVVRFVLPDTTLTGDVAISGHRHLVLDLGKEQGRIHFELPDRFEELIHPYLMRTVGM